MKKNLELVFKICYFILTLMSFNVFFARHWYISYCSYAIIAFGIVIGVLRLLHIRDYLNAGIFLLISFIFSYILGSVISFEFGYLDNLKTVVWMSVQYFLVFAFDKEKEVSFEKNVLFVVVVIYTALCALVSLWMMITEWKYYSLVEGIYWVQGGFIDNRLFGCYTDPNYGAILSIISVVISIDYLSNWKSLKICWKILLIINIVIEFLYVCYSDSRTGIVAIAASVLTLVFLWFVKEKGFIKSIAIGLAISGMIVLAICGVQKTTSSLKVKIAETNAINSGASQQEVEIEKYYARVGREDSQIGGGEDITNNRIDIWGNAIEIFKQHPVTGISYRNIREYALENIPDTYVGYESMHNFFFDILVSQGIIGIIILVVFVIWIICNLIRRYKALNSYKEFAVLMAIIAAIFMSMLTYSEAFYINTGGAFLFWYVLGYLVNSNWDRKDEVEL